MRAWSCPLTRMLSVQSTSSGVQLPSALLGPPSVVGPSGPHPWQPSHLSHSSSPLRHLQLFGHDFTIHSTFLTPSLDIVGLTLPCVVGFFSINFVGRSSLYLPHGAHYWYSRPTLHPPVSLTWQGVVGFSPLTFVSRPCLRGRPHATESTAHAAKSTAHATESTAHATCSFYAVGLTQLCIASLAFIHPLASDIPDLTLIELASVVCCTFPTVHATISRAPLPHSRRRVSSPFVN